MKALIIVTVIIMFRPLLVACILVSDQPPSSFCSPPQLSQPLFEVKVLFLADIALFYHVPCCKLHCAPNSQCVKKLNYFFHTPSFCVLSSVKKQDITSSKYNNGIMSNKGLPPSLIGVELVYSSETNATNSGLIEKQRNL